ncbi:MAG TPA: DUF6516 family protein [archaeon]|nr:DUF6516 family protein [archaeon]
MLEVYFKAIEETITFCPFVVSFSLSTETIDTDFQAENGKIIKRWDNAPHHPEIKTFPDHVHMGSEEIVKEAIKPSIFQIIGEVCRNIEKV